MTRKIIHVDMDCFYAAVEVRDAPELTGKPVAVGGSPSRRGVLCTANYEARRYGVRSAMPTATALRHCPQLIVLPVQMAKYREISSDIHQIFAQYTNLIEPLSLDEAFLDVSDCLEHQGSASRIAEAIRQEIYKTHKITASAGVSINKFLAKVASDWQKPDGLTVVPPDNVAAFVQDLPISKLFGVGPVTATRMHRFGIRSCGDLLNYSAEDLQKHFGSFGPRLFQLARGEDHRPVNPSRQRKSMSVERTFSQDRLDLPQLLESLPALIDELKRRFEKQESLQIQGVVVKIKFADFQQTTASHSGRYYWDQALLENEYTDLIQQAWQRQRGPVRLLGIGLMVQQADDEFEQPDLFV